MARAGEHIDLTSALTLAAFGLELTGTKFVKAMNVESFGIDRAEAIKRFEDALRRLQQSVVAGDLVLTGKYFSGDKPCREELTQLLPPLVLLDYAAFDYSINGLRHGPPQLLWFSADNDGYIQPKLARKSLYKDVRVIRGQVRKFLGVGKSNARNMQRRPPIPDAALRDWYEALSQEEQSLAQQRLFQLAAESHPEFHVSRERVRQLAGPRPRGRPKKSANKN